ncbi:hypothetical protein FN846DRAFT_1012352 [Sphaerosporella brunnea]|uniref:Uncharacterized protein n=1 Tax=Sphaerosporella brunnea TaxID=1250544 RepID=A0A5J5EY82_9PEZI|nr:hypothetical protein FN846DRAFT_1012352 [Sphaerosporella brunnea]
MSVQQDREAQQLVLNGDIAAATPEQIGMLSNRLGTKRNGSQMILFYYVSVRSALRYVGQVHDPGYSLDVEAHAPKLQPFFVQNADQQLLGTTFATLRGCAVFRAAAAAVTRRVAVSIAFDHTRTVDVSCSLVEEPHAVPQPLRLLPCSIGLGPAEKKNTNALLQVLFCVPQLRRLLRPDFELSNATRGYLEELDKARDTREMERIQKTLLQRFAARADDVPTVLVALNCPDSISTTKTNWCAQHMEEIRKTRTRAVLPCDDEVNQVISNALAESKKTTTHHCNICGSVATQTLIVKHRLNTTDGILLAQPSARHPVTDVDEDCGYWKLYAGLLPHGRAFFRDGDVFHLYHPLARLPCAFVSSSQDKSVEEFCANETPELLFYILVDPDVAAMDAEQQGVQQDQGMVVQNAHVQQLNQDPVDGQDIHRQAAQGMVQNAPVQQLNQGPVDGQDIHRQAAQGMVQNAPVQHFIQGPVPDIHRQAAQEMVHNAPVQHFIQGPLPDIHRQAAQGMVHNAHVQQLNQGPVDGPDIHRQAAQGMVQNAPVQHFIQGPVPDIHRQAAQGMVHYAPVQQFIQGPVAGQDAHHQALQAPPGPMLVQQPAPQAIAARPIGILAQLEATRQNMEKMHFGRLPYDRIPVTVMLRREWAGEIDTIQTSVHLSHFRDDDTTELTRRMLSMIGRYVGIMVFDRGVCTLENGIRVPIGAGEAHQQFVNSIKSLEITVIRKEQN